MSFIMFLAVILLIPLSAVYGIFVGTLCGHVWDLLWFVVWPLTRLSLVLCVTINRMFFDVASGSCVTRLSSVGCLTRL